MSSYLQPRHVTHLSTEVPPVTGGENREEAALVPHKRSALVMVPRSYEPILDG